MKLGKGIRVLSAHVDALELTCSVDQVPLLMMCAPVATLGEHVRPLDDRLGELLGGLRQRAQSTTPAGPVDAGLTWKGATVLCQPRARRRGAQDELTSDDWAVFITPWRSVLPRLTVQLRSEYLLRVGPLVAFDEVVSWVSAHLLPLIEGRPADSSEVWRIARLDLAVDVLGVRFALSDLDCFTSRAKRRRAFLDGKGERP